VTRSTRTLLVANPTARSGKAQQSIDRALDGLERMGLAPEFFATLADGATVPALADRLEQHDVDRVVYLGGDGTFAEAAKGIMLARERYGFDIPLGMLPMGTANDQGRSFGILAGEKALESNIEIVAKGCEQWLDVGRVEAISSGGETIKQDLWFDSFGLGLSARILAQRNRDRQLVGKMPLLKNIYRDKLVYAGAGVNTLLRSFVTGTQFACEVIVDGEAHEFTSCTDLVVKGTLLYGGEWIFCEESKPDDGKFEVVVIKDHADWLGTAVRNHKHNPLTDDDREVLGIESKPVLQGKSIELRVFRPGGIPELPAQIDGEEFQSSDHYKVENLFHHLRIIVPDDSRFA